MPLSLHNRLHYISLAVWFHWFFYEANILRPFQEKAPPVGGVPCQADGTTCTPPPGPRPLTSSGPCLARRTRGARTRKTPTLPTGASGSRGPGWGPTGRQSPCPQRGTLPHPVAGRSLQPPTVRGLGYKLEFQPIRTGFLMSNLNRAQLI